MRNIKSVAAAVLAAHIKERIPVLQHVHSVWAEPEEANAYPCAVIVLRRSAYEPNQAGEVLDRDDGVVVTLGRWSATFELRLYATTPTQRGDLEQAVIDLFMEAEGLPGVIPLPLPNLFVSGAPTVYQPVVAFDITSAEWREEMAFAKKRFSFIDVDASLPVLALRNAPNIEQLVSALASQPAESPATMASEEVEIDEDGTIGPPT